MDSFLQVVLSVFLTYTPQHRCLLPVDQSSDRNVTDEILINSIPLDDNGNINSCEMYKISTNASSFPSSKSSIVSVSRAEKD